jgi:hypothetical protein
VCYARIGLVLLAFLSLAGRAEATQPLDLELSSDPLVWDLTGGSFGRGQQGRFDAMRGLQLDSVDVGVRVARRLRLMGRLEVGVDEDRRSRDVLMGAVEMGVRYHPVVTREIRPFVSAGAGWVGGGIMTPDALTLWDHAFNPQVHVQAGVDVTLADGWSFEMRLPFRYLWGPDRPLAAATVGFRYAM